MSVQGRPSRLSQKTISEILRLCQEEILSLREAAKRLGIEHVISVWILTGRKKSNTPVEILTTHEKLCLELFERHQVIKDEQERVLMTHISSIPECAETALLVSCLKPDLTFLNTESWG